MTEAATGKLDLVSDTGMGAVRPFPLRTFVNLLAGLLVMAGLYLARTEGYLLFHTIVEMFTIAVGCGVFMLAWNSRHLAENNYLLWIGIALVFVSILDLAHVLVYTGMHVVEGLGTNPPTQLWIAARLLQSTALLAAPFFVRRKLNAGLALGGFALATILALLSVFEWHVFPVCYDETLDRLTPFKVGSEYVIVGVLLASLVLLMRKADQFGRDVLVFIAGAIVLTIVSELSFTLYTDPYGLSNLVGHYLKLAAFYLIYKALVETGLTRPYELLFRELKQSEDALRESQQRYRSLVELCPDAIAVRVGQACVYANPACIRLFGADIQEALMGKTVMELIPASHLQLEIERTRLAESTAEQTPWLESRIRRLDGQEVDIEAAAIRTTFQGKIATQVVMRDISERKRTEQRLKSLNETLEQRVAERSAVAERRAEQIRSLAAELTRAEQRERRRLAEVLHDHFQQLLAAVKLQVKIVRSGSTDEEVREILQQVSDSVDQLIQLSRTLAVEVSPPALTHGGLAEALQWLGAQMKEKYNFRVTVKADPSAEPELDEVRSLLFQSVRELLFNTVKHAQVDSASVSMARHGDDGIEITVEDSGVGFDPARLEAENRGSTGFGLFSVRGRLELLGGRLEIESAPFQGSRFTLIAPAQSRPAESGRRAGAALLY